MPAYTPHPIDTAGVSLPSDLDELTERLAEDEHENWLKERILDGWELGETLDDRAKIHPNLLPYADIPAADREYYRTKMLQTLRVILKLGYRIER